MKFHANIHVLHRVNPDHHHHHPDDSNSLIHDMIPLKSLVPALSLMLKHCSTTTCHHITC